jgi:phage shock protein E
MKNVLVQSVFTLLLAAFATSCQSQPASQSHVTVNVVAFEDALKKAQTPIILDVRTPGEVAEGVIEGAIVIDFYDPKFMEKVNKLDKNKPIFVYCRSGARSGKALEMMRNAGFVEVTNLSGGSIAWVSSGRKLKV